MSIKNLLAATLLAAGAAQSAPLSSAFTYQGELKDAGVPANNLYDFEVCLFAVASGPDPALLCADVLQDRPVENGLFTVDLDFGSALFDGQERFLEMRVRPFNSTDAFITLSPRQRVAATPYAQRATTVADAAVNTLQIASGAVTNSRLGDGSVDSLKIENGTINGADIANGAIGIAQINSAEVQARISGSCPAGESLRGINANGSVICEPAPGARRITVVEDPPSRNVGTNVSMAIPADGLPFIAYRESTQGELRTVKCGNSACSAGNVLSIVDGAGDTGFSTQIAIGSDGLPVIAYVESSGTSDNVKYVHCGNAACNAGNGVVTIENTASDLGAGLAMAIGSDGFPVFSYGDRSANLALRFARCTSLTCGAGTVTAIELDNPSNDVGIDTALTIGNDGFPFIVYRDSTDGSTDAVHCGSVDCSTGNVFTPGIEGANGAAELDLTVSALAAPFGPMVVFRRSGTPGLFALYCSGNDCTAASNTITPIVDTAGHNMQSFSLRIGADALPVISYHDSSVLSLNLLRCGNRDCTAGNTFATLDNTFSLVGAHNALAIGSDGLPVVAYEHGTNSASRVIKCGSVSCQ